MNSRFTLIVKDELNFGEQGISLVFETDGEFKIIGENGDVLIDDLSAEHLHLLERLTGVVVDWLDRD